MGFSAGITGAPAVVRYLNNFGADPTGTLDSTPAFNEALASLPTEVIDGNTYSVGTIMLGNSVYMNSTYRFNETPNNPGAYVSVIGPGIRQCTWAFYGSGDAFRAYNPNSELGEGSNFLAVGYGGSFKGFTIDGTNSSAGSIGFHGGDMEDVEVDLMVQNFAGAGSIGYWFNNTVSWTEKWTARCRSLNNTQAAYFSVSSSATAGRSFGYCSFDFRILANVNQIGVQVDAGSNIYNGWFKVRGDFTLSNAAQTAYVLGVTGVTPVGNSGAGTSSTMFNVSLDVKVEASRNGGVGGASNGPISLYFDTVNFTSIRGIGSLVFSGCANSNNTGLGDRLWFEGIIYGDTVLNPAGGTNPLPVTIGQHIGKLGTLGATGALDLSSGNAFSNTLTQNMNIVISNFPQGPALWWIRLAQAASGGPYTVTWPATIIWPGGTKPVMSTGAGAIDVYILRCANSEPIFGEALQALA